MVVETNISVGGAPNIAAAVDIVIVNWNSQSLLDECLASLDQSTIAARVNVVVVDNASQDGSAGRLAVKRMALQAVVNGDNVGFAAACNQGARKAHAPLLLFMNPDVRVETDAVEKAVAYLADPAHASVGVLGIQLLDAEGNVQRSCARAPTAAVLLLHTLFLDRLWPTLVPPHFLAEWDHGETRSVDQVMGAFLMIRRALFEQLGGFDERFFLYYDDVDLCLRARQAGWSVVHFAGARAQHTGGGATEAVKDRRLFYLATSKVQYAAKRHGRVLAAVLIAFVLLFEMPMRWFYATVTRSPREGWFIIRATTLFWQNLPRLSLRIVGGRE
jgi:N-acetylglucosaminyl-diphospho-decaprenol L-rhamnosyltransferase